MVKFIENDEASHANTIAVTTQALILACLRQIAVNKSTDTRVTVTYSTTSTISSVLVNLKAWRPVRVIGKDLTSCPPGKARLTEYPWTPVWTPWLKIVAENKT